MSNVCNLVKKRIKAELFRWRQLSTLAKSTHIFRGLLNKNTQNPFIPSCSAKSIFKSFLWTKRERAKKGNPTTQHMPLNHSGLLFSTLFHKDSKESYWGFDMKQNWIFYVVCDWWLSMHCIKKPHTRADFNFLFYSYLIQKALYTPYNKGKGEKSLFFSSDTRIMEPDLLNNTFYAIDFEHFN